MFLFASAVLFFRAQLGLPLWLAGTLAVLVGGLSGMALYYGLYRHFIRRKAPLFILALLSLAFFTVTENALAAVLGAQRFYFIQGLLPGWDVLGVRLNAAHLSKIGLGLLVLAALWLFFEHKANDPGSALSYAQQKMLSLARLTALDPAVMALDEPTAGVDFRRLSIFLGPDRSS